MKAIRAAYDEMFELCAQTTAAFIHDVDPRGTFEVTTEERYEFWEQLYASPGFGIWQGNFKDILTDPKANKAISDFIACKIRGACKRSPSGGEVNSKRSWLWNQAGTPGN